MVVLPSLCFRFFVADCFSLFSVVGEITQGRLIIYSRSPLYEPVSLMLFIRLLSFHVGEITQVGGGVITLVLPSMKFWVAEI